MVCRIQQEGSQLNRVARLAGQVSQGEFCQVLQANRPKSTETDLLGIFVWTWLFWVDWMKGRWTALKTTKRRRIIICVTPASCGFNLFELWARQAGLAYNGEQSTHSNLFVVRHRNGDGPICCFTLHCDVAPAPSYFSKAMFFENLA